MVDLEDLRKRPGAYREAAKKKNIPVDVDAFLKVDARRRELLALVEDMRAKKNSVNKRIPAMKGKEKETALAEMKSLTKELKERDEELKNVETAWGEMQLELPAIPLPNVPVGKDATGNVEAKRWGDPPEAHSWQKDHVELGEALGILDIPRGVKVAGPRSYFLKGDGARLHLAVLRFTIDRLLAKGWTLITPPLMANWECFMGTGFFPGVDEQNIYAVGGKSERESSIESDNLYLIGTSEVSVCSYHKDEVLPESELPKRYCGYSACFRREAGTYGKDTKGLYRVHQFEKVEQVVLCRADQEEALAMFEEIRTNAEAILQALHLPYRVMDICTGDMGKGKVLMQDIETWMPSRKNYGETHSCSYLGDFQARRLNIKYETGSHRRFMHTLNNTCIASPRILIPLLEIHQQRDGTIAIPEVLQPYMGGQEVIGR